MTTLRIIEGFERGLTNEQLVIERARRINERLALHEMQILLPEAERFTTLKGVEIFQDMQYLTTLISNLEKEMAERGLEIYTQPSVDALPPSEDEVTGNGEAGSQ